MARSNAAFLAALQRKFGGGASSSPYVARCLLCTALCNRARPLARATPATDEEVSARRTHDLWRRAAHLHARSKLLLAHMAAACPHHFSADSLFHGLPMCSVFRSKPESHKPDKKSSFPHLARRGSGPLSAGLVPICTTHQVPLLAYSRFLDT